MVRTRFSDKNARVFAQLRKHLKRRGLHMDVSLCARHDHGKARERNLLGNDLSHLMEHLRIGDDERGWLFERSERGRKLGIAHQIRQRSPIEQIAGCLHLR